MDLVEKPEASEVTGRPVEWFPAARELLERAEPGGPEVLDWLEHEIKANRLTLFEVRDTWERIGIFTARWYMRYDGKKILSIVHGVSLKDEEGFSLMLSVENLVKKIATDCGCAAVEIHTRRRGMDRRLERHGYEFQETIFSVKV